MATLNRMESMRLVEHRRWEDILAMILGAAILISPMFGDTAGNTTMVAATAIVGAAIVVLAGLEQLCPAALGGIPDVVLRCLGDGVAIHLPICAEHCGPGISGLARPWPYSRSWNSGRTATVALKPKATLR